MIPILDLVPQYESLKDDIDRAVSDVLASGSYINGSNVAALEAEIAAYVGTRYAVGLNSGTDALHLALRALGIGPGDEVITSPFTFIATTEAILLVGARPVFVDIEPLTLALDPDLVEAAITPATKAILPVHLYGAPAAMERLCGIADRHGLAIVEDCAQAIGADIAGRRVGTFGVAGCFSFFPTKNLGAFGDGGMLVTNSQDLAERTRALRAHGGRVKYHHEVMGVNSRLDELQAAILRVKLPHLDRWTAARRQVAGRYDAGLRDLPGLEIPRAVSGHVYHQYTLALTERDRAQSTLQRNGIQSVVYYPVPLHLQAVHADLGYRRGDFPISERAAESVLSLPIYPELDEDHQSAIIRAVADVINSSRAVTSAL